MSQETTSKQAWMIFGGAVIVAIAILALGLRQPSSETPDQKVTLLGPVDGFLPHRALYDIKMTSQKDSSALLNLTGQLAYEWRPDCDGVLTNYHFNMRYDYNAAPSVALRTHISNYELFSGGLEFVLQRHVDGEEAIYLKGAANENARQVVFDDETLEPMALPAGTLFPTSHMQGVIKAIREGQSSYFAYLFDGSEEKGTLAVNTLIGQEVDPLYKVDQDNTDINPKALDAPARKIVLAFYPADNVGQEVPDYEMDAIFHENGVMRNLDITYDTFSVSQDLVSIEILDNQCR